MNWGSAKATNHCGTFTMSCRIKNKKNSIKRESAGFPRNEPRRTKEDNVIQAQKDAGFSQFVAKCIVPGCKKPRPEFPEKRAKVVRNAKMDPGSSSLVPSTTLHLQRVVISRFCMG